MPDITMCKGTKCKLKDRCYRYVATPDSWQSWFVKIPYKNGACDNFWEYNKE